VSICAGADAGFDAGAGAGETGGKPEREVWRGSAGGMGEMERSRRWALSRSRAWSIRSSERPEGMRGRLGTLGRRRLRLRLRDIGGAFLEETRRKKRSRFPTPSKPD
jgi:hypothetical protein